MKNMLYGIGLLFSGSIGIGSCIIAIHQNQIIPDASILHKLIDSSMSIPFAIFAVLAIIGLIISTKEFFNE